jgi:hypothetical protein
VNDGTEMQNASKPTPPVADQSASASSALQTITRLLVGGALLGTEILQQQMKSWEQSADLTSSSEDEGVAAEGEASTAEGQPQPPDSVSDQTQYALLGLVFQSQTYLQRGGKTLGRAERAAWRVMTPVHKPLRTWRVFAPARRRYERLVARGEAKVDRWVKLGRAEAQRSRELTGTVLETTVDNSIDFVTTSPQVREVIRETSSGLGSEAADALRGRSVSADTIAEGLARRIFRRSPREYPPEPPFSREMLKNDQSRGD